MFSTKYYFLNIDDDKNYITNNKTTYNILKLNKYNIEFLPGIINSNTILTQIDTENSDIFTIPNKKIKTIKDITLIKHNINVVDNDNIQTTTLDLKYDNNNIFTYNSQLNRIEHAQIIIYMLYNGDVYITNDLYKEIFKQLSLIQNFIYFNIINKNEY